MWDIATAKAYLGIEGDSQNTAIAATMAAVLRTVEAYLDRGLLRADVTEIRSLNGNSCFLRWYPVDETSPITIDVTRAGSTLPLDAASYQLNGAMGLVASPAFIGADRVTISYVGGFETLPADLEWTLWQILAARWNSSQGNPTASPAPVDAGSIKAVQLYGVGAVTYGDATGSTSSGTQGGELAPFAPALAPYVSHAKWSGASNAAATIITRRPVLYSVDIPEGGATAIISLFDGPSSANGIITVTIEVTGVDDPDPVLVPFTAGQVVDVIAITAAAAINVVAEDVVSAITQGSEIHLVAAEDITIDAITISGIGAHS